MNIDVGDRTLLATACCTPISAKKLARKDAEVAAGLLKALSDPHRVMIVNLLGNADQPVCVCDITDAVALSQPTISFHLKKLHSAGLIRREQRGTWAYYSLEEGAMDQLKNLFDVNPNKDKAKGS